MVIQNKTKTRRIEDEEYNRRVATDFEDLRTSSYGYYYIYYLGLDVDSIQNENIDILSSDDHPMPSIFLLEIDIDDIFDLIREPITFDEAVQQVVLKEVNRMLKQK